MAARKKVVQTPTGPQQGPLVDIVSSTEHFNTYVLEDGAVIKLKTVAVECIRLDEGQDAEGNPIYVLGTRNVVSLGAPTTAKR